MNSGITVTVDELSESIEKELNNYNKTVISATKENAKKYMDKLVKKTKETAPKNRPKYYKNITSKQTANSFFGVEFTWYVKGSEYRLSHLLENGHAKRNGGRVEGTHFIKKASEPIIQEFIKSIEEAVKGDKKNT